VLCERLTRKTFENGTSRNSVFSTSIAFVVEMFVVSSLLGDGGELEDGNVKL